MKKYICFLLDFHLVGFDLRLVVEYFLLFDLQFLYKPLIDMIHFDINLMILFHKFRIDKDFLDLRVIPYHNCFLIVGYFLLYHKFRFDTMSFLAVDILLGIQLILKLKFLVLCIRFEFLLFLQFLYHKFLCFII